MKPIKEMLGQKMTNLSDQIIVDNALAAKALESSAYLTATLGAATPELKQLFSANITQTIGEHSALLALAETKGWINPYEQPEKLLLETFHLSKEMLDQDNPVDK